MDALIKQMRVRLSGVGQENKEDPGSSRERRIPLQKTQSFKGEKKAQNWFRRQFSRQMSRDYDPSDGGEYTTAVAAAAFAINSLEESGIPDQKEKSEGPKIYSTESKSKKEDTTIGMREPGRLSRRFTGEASMKNSEGPDSTVPISAATSGTMPRKAVAPDPSIKKTPSFADKHLNNTSSTKPESAARKPDMPSTIQPAVPPTETKRQSSTRPGIGETDADAWEKAEMAKVKKRYEKLNTKILSWENKKKTKAKRRMDRTQSELEGRRARAFQHYGNDMERINQVAGGARAKAEEGQRNEEFKVKEKANKIRSTGKVPVTCFCF